MAAAFWISKLCPRRLQGDQAEPPPPSSRSMPSSPCVLAPGAWGGSGLRDDPPASSTREQLVRWPLIPACSASALGSRTFWKQDSSFHLYYSLEEPLTPHGELSCSRRAVSAQEPERLQGGRWPRSGHPIRALAQGGGTRRPSGLSGTCVFLGFISMAFQALEMSMPGPGRVQDELVWHEVSPPRPCCICRNDSRQGVLDSTRRP